MICLSIYTLTIAILVSERTSDIFYPLIAPVRRSIIAVSHLMTNSDSFHPLFSGFLSLFPSVKALCDNRIAKAAGIALILSLTAVKAVNRDNLPPAVNCDNLLLRLCGFAALPLRRSRPPQKQKAGAVGIVKRCLRAGVRASVFYETSVTIELCYSLLAAFAAALLSLAI